jgi:anti-anti-sigma factor
MHESAEDAFAIERHGDVIVIVALPPMGKLDADLLEGASTLILEPLREAEIPYVVFDLSRLDFFGSTMLVLLLRCYKVAHAKGGQIALAGPNENIRHVLHLTSMDTVWPIYGTQDEAIEALSSD